MSDDHTIGRRSVLLGAAGATAAGFVGGLPALGSAADVRAGGRPPLWKVAEHRGIVFGSSIATWQLDPRYSKVFAREAGLLWPEDDLLWYQLKPTPESRLDFSHGDAIFKFAKQNHQLAVGNFLVWDEGFGEGWTDDDLWGLGKRRAKKLLYGVARALVKHYKGELKAWIVANEVTDPEGDKHGFRTNVPWYNTIGPSYIGRCFEIAKEHDPNALRVLNEFGFETVNQYGDTAAARRRAMLKAIDRLLDRKVPVQALGIQGHLLADDFHKRFHERAYRQFLKEVSDRGLKILITEMDVLDDGLPKAPKLRDQKVADVYRHYLDVTLDETAVKMVNTFGLTDRYTWLDEDYPRDDGAHRRPLAFDRDLHVKPAYYAISHSLKHSPHRNLIWQLKKG
ncbi:MAG: endo-1,4-beta-xylanase [Nocardioidaceae bacterium]